MLLLVSMAVEQTFRISHCPSLWFSRKGSIHFIHSTSLTLVGLKHEQIFFPKQQKSRRELFYRQHMAKREANSWFSKDLQKSSAHWHVKQGAGTRCFTAPVCWWSTTESHFCLRLLQHSGMFLNVLTHHIMPLNVSGTLWHWWSLAEFRASAVGRNSCNELLLKSTRNNAKHQNIWMYIRMKQDIQWDNI